MKLFLSFCPCRFFLFTSSLCHVQTQFGKGAEEYNELLDDLKTMLLNAYEVDTVKLNGNDRNQFVCWIRDHVHVMKAMKYLVSDISSFWQFYMEHKQTRGYVTITIVPLKIVSI